MRIGFTGSQGTGKSTLVKAMFEWPELEGYAFVSGGTRHIARKTGIGFNEHGNLKTQETLFEYRSRQVEANPDIVIDRTFLDLYAYSLYAQREGKITSYELSDLYSRTRMLQPMFDVVFYVDREFDIQSDGVRSTDESFTHKMDVIFEDLMREGDWFSPKCPYSLTGSVEDRLATIKEVLRDCTL